jgi:hypothetical protein
MTDDELAAALTELAPDTELEQEVEFLLRVAGLAGAFYTALQTEGLPGALAGRLVEQWHEAQLRPQIELAWGEGEGDGPATA